MLFVLIQSSYHLFYLTADHKLKMLNDVPLTVHMQKCICTVQLEMDHLLYGDVASPSECDKKTFEHHSRQILSVPELLLLCSRWHLKHYSEFKQTDTLP